MNLRSKIYRGTVTHKRLHPVDHAFSYPLTFFVFDLAELSQISNQAPIFSYNERNLLSLKDRDYLHGKNYKIIQQLDQLIPFEKKDEHTQLVTSPRYFGYAFNPVNFHLRMKKDQLQSVVAEVNNTFGDRHVYPLKELTQTYKNTWIAQCPKDFHVSPFNNMDGEYRFTFKISSEQIFMGVDLYRDGQCILKTWLEGRPKPITNASIFKYALLHPFDTAFNSMPRILLQAALLHYKKKLQAYERPFPSSKNTLVDRGSIRKETTVV